MIHNPVRRLKLVLPLLGIRFCPGGGVQATSWVAHGHHELPGVRICGCVNQSLIRNSSPFHRCMRTRTTIYTHVRRSVHLVRTPLAEWSDSAGQARDSDPDPGSRGTYSGAQSGLFGDCLANHRCLLPPCPLGSFPRLPAACIARTLSPRTRAPCGSPIFPRRHPRHCPRVTMSPECRHGLDLLARHDVALIG